jgi:DNA modification methylase
MFKLSVAKYIYMKYSKEGDTVYDYSAGFGGRLLGAASCNRKYIGIDPATSDSLNKMIDGLNLQNCLVMQGCSEDYKDSEDSIDLAFSSPPYFDQEIYTDEDTQAYNKGPEYFYDVYWDTTLNNIKHMLKPGKYFILNVKNDKMVEMAKKYFQYDHGEETDSRE